MDAVGFMAAPSVTTSTARSSQLTSLTSLLIVVLSLLVFGVVLLSGTWAQSDGGVFMVSL